MDKQAVIKSTEQWLAREMASLSTQAYITAHIDEIVIGKLDRREWLHTALVAFETVGG